MPRDVSGNYTLPTGNPVVTGTIIDVNWANPTMSDIALQLNNVITRDGLLGPTANIPFNNFKITGMSNGSVPTDSVTYGQVQNSSPSYLTSVAGGDTITALLPGLAAYTIGQTFNFVTAAANTGAVTININGLGAKAITKAGSTPLVAADLGLGVATQITYDGTQFQLSSGSGGGATGGSVFLSAKTLVASVNIGTGYHGHTVGPLSIPTGMSITVASGSRFLVL